MLPEKQVLDHSDQQLSRAQALFEQHRAMMNPHDHSLAQSLLDYSSELRQGFEEKCLLAPTRITQAQLYCTQVDKTLQKIQAVVDEIDARIACKP